MREKKYVEADYQKLKSEMLAMHLDQKYEYAPMFRLIESRVADDDNTFLNNCDREYDNLNPRDRTLLILNLTRLIEPKDQAMKQKLSTFIRSRLAKMDGNTISLSGRMLDSIEKE